MSYVLLHNMLYKIYTWWYCIGSRKSWHSNIKDWIHLNFMSLDFFSNWKCFWQVLENPFEFSGIPTSKIWPTWILSSYVFWASIILKTVLESSFWDLSIGYRFSTVNPQLQKIPFPFPPPSPDPPLIIQYVRCPYVNVIESNVCYKSKVLRLLL